MLSTHALGGLTADVISAISSFREGQRLSLIHIWSVSMIAQVSDSMVKIVCGFLLWQQRLYLFEDAVQFRLRLCPLFKGIPNFSDTRIAMLRAETKEELYRLFEEIEPLLP